MCPDGILSAQFGKSMKTAAASTTMRRPRASSSAGMAMVEVVIGMALLLMVLAMLFAMNGQLLSLLNYGKQSTYATQLIAERVEQMRTSWEAVTLRANLKANLDKESATATESNLPGVTETITIEPYHNPAGRKMECVRTADGPQDPTGVDFPDEKLVRVKISVKWKTGKRERERQFVTMMSFFRG